jgi:mannan endo-1,4-beta-mannosidase
VRDAGPIIKLGAKLSPLLAAAVLAGCGLRWVPGPERPHPAAAPPAARAPARPWLGVATAAQSPAAAGAFARLTGQQPRISEYYVSFGSLLRSVPAFLHTGMLPLIQLDPSHQRVAAIAAGQYDSYLAKIAAELRDDREQVAVSFGHEMNGSWYSWGEPGTTPAEFIAAWRHIHDIFQAAGARNVIWVWTVTQEHPQSVRAWWPGAAYVSWVGINGYYMTPSERFSQIDGPAIRSVRAFTGDPVLLTEVAVYRNPESYAQVTDLFRSAQADHVKAIVWFNENRVRPWSLQGDPAALAALRAAERG